MAVVVIDSFLCHECGSNCAISKVIYGKIKINMCDKCIEKKDDQEGLVFSELGEKAKTFAFAKRYKQHCEDAGHEVEMAFVWNILDNDKRNLFDDDGDLIEDSDVFEDN